MMVQRPTKHDDRSVSIELRSFVIIDNTESGWRGIFLLWSVLDENFVVVRIWIRFSAPEIVWNLSLKITIVWFNSALIKGFFLCLHPVIVFLQRLLLYMQWCARTSFTQMLCMPPVHASFFLLFFSLNTYCVYSVYSVQNIFSCTYFLAGFFLFQAQKYIVVPLHLDLLHLEVGDWFWRTLNWAPYSLLVPIFQGHPGGIAFQPPVYWHTAFLGLHFASCAVIIDV